MNDAGAAATPSDNYRAGVARGDWQDDPAQHEALRELDRLHVALTQPRQRPGLLQRLFGDGPPPPEPGLYLWGGVGRGKTFLIDLFFDGLPIREKRRTHFHRFMRDVHERLRAHTGERDPLAIIAREWRASLRVLVLDEFFVSDIGDAMLLGRLLERLFTEGVLLVTTSNSTPDTLYKDGLQRARFLPAIALIKQHCRVVHLDSDTDYRLRELTRSPVYRAPLDDGSDAWLEARWHALGGDDAHRNGSIELDGRKLPVRARCKGMAWFDFSALCEGPRAASDYIEIAREFHTVLLGGIPVMDAQRDDAARRFITLIDELYDRHVNLVCTADASPPMLYGGERLRGAFERTTSRLFEMQSTAYLTLEHRQ
ncbi:cell division protein ZapE [Luteimonas cucumeris]|uniref:Cell division protein ZapE n=1 Tax=Luteimonas cucumeris TaxID=985012 RepID=A0A562KUR1_9GAMM|nr:cell division protein ZapE [Luteimonas cucumeris]TWH99169.1 cell division protein ZapE [Luteimonas cucumeris]